MNIREVIKSQYLASLEMLRHAVLRCPAELWDSPDDKNRFWRVAYHALFYTHLYLQSSEAEFRPWPKHREESEFMGPLPWPPHRMPKPCDPYSQAEVLEFVQFCREQVETQVAQVDFEAASGFDWLPMNKFELQIYSIRHLQLHVGELCERVSARAGIEVGWVGMGRHAGA